jgi:ankyrin repeat protein
MVEEDSPKELRDSPEEAPKQKKSVKFENLDSPTANVLGENSNEGEKQHHGRLP